MDNNELRVTTTDVMGASLQRLQLVALVMLVAGLVLCGVGYAMRPGGFFEGYLYAYWFWVGITSGSLGLLMLHHTVGGGWGFLLRRFLEAATSLPVILALGVLFVPIVLGLPHLYGGEHGWAGDHVRGDAVLQAKSPYLNVGGFIARAAVYFLIWLVFAHFLHAWGKTQNERADPAISNRLNILGAFGILVQVLVVTFASVDWIMSLTPHWFSSIFGLLSAASHVLATLALMLVLLAVLAGDRPLVRGIPAAYFRDLGNLTLALVLLWAYMAFSQYLITFSGNTAEEATWYVARQQGGWQWFGTLLIAAHFALPFLVLLIGSGIKRDPRRLAGVAIFLVVMRLVDCFWLVAPTFRASYAWHPADCGAPLLIGGIWLWLWASQVKDRPVVPLYDPRFQEHLRVAAAHGHDEAAHETQPAAPATHEAPSHG